MPELRSGELHVWRVFHEDSAGDAARLESLLSSEERSEQRRFLHDSDRRAYAARRGVLRCLLGGYLRMAPASVAIQRGRNGKPELSPSGRHEPLHFSLSQTRGMSLFAFSREGGIGVDVEAVDRTVDPVRMAAWIRLPAARSQLQACPDWKTGEAFFAAWTVQEACAKAMSSGLGPLLDNPEGVEHREAAGGLTVTTLDVGPGYAAALAFPGESLALAGWQWPCACPDSRGT